LDIVDLTLAKYRQQTIRQK
jgi:hypothetical protein